MADSRRETIIGAILTRAATIKTGYNYALGNNVFRAVKEIDPSKLPAIIVWPQRESAERIGAGLYLITMQVIIEAVAAFGTTNPSVVAEKLLADVRKAFMGSTTPISNLIENISYTEGGTNDYPETGQEVVGIQATFAIQYQSAINNPYS